MPEEPHSILADEPGNPRRKGYSKFAMSRSKINKVIIGKRPEKRSANSQNDIKRKRTRNDSRVFLFGYLWTFIIVIFLGKFNVFFFVHERKLPPSKTVLNKRSHPAIYISL